MRIKQTTIDNYRLQVEKLINEKKWSEALDISSRYPLGNGYVICKTRLKSKYKISEEDLLTLTKVEKKNPHYSSANSMVLFLEPEVNERFALRG
jgi:hypothetical protein